MNRRAFFRTLALSAAGLYLPTKTFFLPPAGGWAIPETESDVGFASPRDLTVQIWDDELMKLREIVPLKSFQWFDDCHWLGVAVDGRRFDSRL